LLTIGLAIVLGRSAATAEEMARTPSAAANYGP
jgi:hypothetical protein